MKKLLALLLFAALVAFAAHAAEMISQVRMLSMLDVPKTREAQAAFDGLKPEAVQFGLGEAVLIGAVEYQALSEVNTRVTIRWHSIGINNMGSQAAQTLQKPLISQFTVDAKRVDPNTLISVRGDLDQVAEAFLALKERLAKATPRDLVSKKETIKEGTNTEKANANELSPAGSGSAGGGNLGNSPWSANSDQNKVQTDLTVTTWEDCAPRIDRSGGFVYPQSRRIDKGETSGRLMGTGSCEDHGDAVAIQTVYGGDCADVVDVDQKKTFQQYRMFAAVAGKNVDVALCTVDFAKFYTIVGNPSTCGFRHDFVNGLSIAQEKLEYTDSTGTIKTVRDCGDSSQSFTQYKTENTCSPTVDGPNSVVIMNNRVAFKDNNGAEQYATACAPDSTKQYVISEAFCSPKYEHDFVNHVSYYVTSTYYVDASNNTHALSTCTRSASNSFPHIFQTTGCAVTNDDANLMTHWNKLTQINTPTDGVLTIAPCGEIGSPTPYAYLGEVRTTAQTGHASGLAQSVNSLTVPAMQQMAPGANYTSSLNSYSCVLQGDQIGLNPYTGGSYTPCPSPFSTTGTGTLWVYPLGYWSYGLNGNYYYKQYLRGDGTNFQSGAISHNELSMWICAKSYLTGACP